MAGEKKREIKRAEQLQWLYPIRKRLHHGFMAPSGNLRQCVEFQGDGERSSLTSQPPRSSLQAWSTSLKLFFLSRLTSSKAISLAHVASTSCVRRGSRIDQSNEDKPACRGSQSASQPASQAEIQPCCLLLSPRRSTASI